MDTEIKNTQLTSAFGYDTKRLLFSKPIIGNIPNSTPQISFYRVMIGTRNEDKTVGDLIVPTIDPKKEYNENGSDKPELFSFGLSDNKGLDGQVNGYVMPICLWNRNGATPHEKAWTDTFDKIVEACKDHILSINADVGKYDMERGDLKKLNPLYWKRDKTNKGKIVDGTGPTLYAKLITSKKQSKFMTQFYDYNGDALNPQSIMSKYCYGRFAFKFESIFIGNKISLQIKLYEAEIRFADSDVKRLLSRPKPSLSLMSRGNRDSDNEDNFDNNMGSDIETGSLDNFHTGNDDYNNNKEITVSSMQNISISNPEPKVNHFTEEQHSEQQIEQQTPKKIKKVIRK